jgi:succinate-semialdehyde dehydrogenase/glutarate-semialdehyde dehydrogenase
MKNSGSGRRNGVDGLLKYTESQAIGIHRGLLEFPSHGYQYNRMAPLLNLLARIMRRL